MSATQTIRNAIDSMPQGAVFSSFNFLSVGTRAAVDQALYRMMKGGTITRVTRGLYAANGEVVETQAVAAAVAHKTGEQVALAPSEASGNVVVVATSGMSRTVKAMGHTLQFRRMSQRKVQLAASPKGRILLELWSRGIKNVTTIEIKQATEDWLDSEIESYLAMIPAWLRTAIQEANALRKSVKIGLSGAYDWSNPHIKDDVLIGKVLETHKFEDVARLCFYYGLPKVKRVFKQREFEPITTASVARMLANISKGLRTPKEHALAQPQT
jgi:hypothetical protein